MANLAKFSQKSLSIKRITTLFTTRRLAFYGQKMGMVLFSFLGMPLLQQTRAMEVFF
jgi:hypothetical protein